jgi:O-antigen/teichoic acid export membrane protein
MTTAADATRPSLTRQAGALASGSFATQVLAVVMLIALARLVSKAELGGYQQLALLYGILQPLLVGGIPAALLYFVPRSADPAEARAWLGHAYLLLGSSGLAVSVAFALARVPLADALGNPALADPLLVYAPLPFFAFMASVATTGLVAVRRAGVAAALSAFSGALTLVAVLVAVAIEPDTAHMAAGLVVAAACSAVVSTYAVQRIVGIAFRRADVARGMRALLVYGVPLALTGLVGRLAWQFDRLVVSHEFSAAVFAVYAIGAVELPITSIIQQSINAVLVPALSERYAAGDVDGMAALWRRAIRRSSLILLPTFVFFMLIAGEFIALLFGAGFSDSTSVFRIYLLLVPIRVATYGIITQAIGRTRINLMGSFLFLGANAILVLALVGPLGLEGPALGTVLATAALAIYYLVRLRAVLTLSIRALFPWSLLAANLAVSALAGVPVALLILAGVDGPLQLLLGGVLYGACYVGLMLAARRFDAQEIEWGRQLLRTLLGRRRLSAGG